jgi:hypothetical protein
MLRAIRRLGELQPLRGSRDLPRRPHRARRGASAASTSKRSSRMLPADRRRRPGRRGGRVRRGHRVLGRRHGAAVQAAARRSASPARAHRAAVRRRRHGGRLRAGRASCDHLEYAAPTRSRRWRGTAPWPCCCPAPGTACGRRSCRRWPCCASTACRWRGQRRQSRHLARRQPAHRVAHGRRVLRPDPGRGAGRRDAPCGARAGRAAGRARARHAGGLQHLGHGATRRCSATSWAAAPGSGLRRGRRI